MQRTPFVIPEQMREIADKSVVEAKKTFELARKFVQARTVEEVAALQEALVRRPTAAGAEQGKRLGAALGKSPRHGSAEVKP